MARLTVHEERAISALPRIGAVDLAILDGDPSWFAVHSELTMLIAAAKRAGEPAPLVLVHNAHWPFGRRDGYYEPEAIPAELRGELSELGLIPGRREPVAGGLRLTPFCATRDFAPRSGVLTAVEDVVAASDLEWTVVEVPGFHGCVAMVDAQRLRARPAVDGVLEGFRAGGFLSRQVRHAEMARLDLAVELSALMEGEPPEPDAETAAVEDERDLGALRDAELVARDAEIESMREESRRLQENVVEHRSRREALEWQVARLDQDLLSRDGRIEALTEERDRERLGLAEVRVRLEQAATGLEAERDAAAAAGGRVVELEDELLRRRRELESLGERERLAQGKLSHREEALQAASAEAEQLRAEVESLRARLDAAQATMDEVAQRIDQAGSTRWARAGARLSRIGRALRPGGGDRPLPPIELALAAAERGLPEPTAGDQPGGEAEDIAAEAADSAIRQPR